MPSGVYKRTTEHRRILSETKKREWKDKTNEERLKHSKRTREGMVNIPTERQKEINNRNSIGVKAYWNNLSEGERNTRSEHMSVAAKQRMKLLTKEEKVSRSLKTSKSVFDYWQSLPEDIKAERVKKIMEGLTNMPEEAKAKMVLGRIKKMIEKPNTDERILEIALNDNVPSEWKYNDGFLILGGRWVPDFVNVSGQRKLIELFGSHWHLPGEESIRIQIFKQYDYKTLIVWDYELLTPELDIKLKTFCREDS